MKIGRLLLRVLVGGLFVGHGTQKLFGWFGGAGLAQTAEGFEQIGLRPGRRHALAAGVAEAGGGALLTVGLQTPLAAAALIATMLTAVYRVHGKNGPWATNGGYEYNAVLIAAALVLAESGPGSVSLDGARGSERTGSQWALLALALGAAGAIGASFAVEEAPRGVPAQAPSQEPSLEPEPPAQSDEQTAAGETAETA